jgi:23S rRNA (cytidine1920-2'-O)/16S rRNA (cytidine1409-2'-O)-methyltransferase
MDLSFISLLHVLPAVISCVRPGGSVIALIKPQFELTPAQISKGGIVRDEAARAEAVEKIRAWVQTQPHLTWASVIPSPITGTDGNVEFLVWLQLAR